jgi:DNA (cytosine-5)-methyltransferase 1
MELKVLDLFSGIGGFALGLERAGMNTVAFCEQDGYACRVLRKHWPTVPIFEDVRTLTARRLKQHGIFPNVICGGFPCQDISTAGKGAGLAGERSGLWREYARLIREIRPRYAIMENVAALRSRGLDQVTADLAAIGYDAEWHCIPASAVGAPHQRDRAWIVAYPKGTAKLDPLIWERDFAGKGNKAAWPSFSSCRSRVADGVPNRMDRLRCLGNAAVPQIVELIGNAIVNRERAMEGSKPCSNISNPAPCSQPQSRPTCHPAAALPNPN